MLLKIRRLFCSFPFQMVCRLFVGGLFIYASFDKIVRPLAFADILHNYDILPDILIYPTAALLPWIELLAGLFLIVGIFTRTSAILLSLLLAVFTIAIVFNILRGLNFDCGCFTTTTGDGESHGMVLLIIRDLLFLIPGLIVVFFHREKTRVKITR